MSDKKLCFLCKSKAKATVHMLNVQVKTAKNVQISFFDAMKNLTGIDLDDDNDESRILCLDCQHSIKFAHKIRQEVLDAFGVEPTPMANTVEVYEIVNDGMEFKCIETHDEDGQEGADLIEITEVDENFEPEDLTAEYDYCELNARPRAKKRTAAVVAASSGDDSQDPMDAVSFLLEKRDLFNESDETNSSKNANRRTHKCDVCEKSFMRKSNLVDHLRLHANLRLFQCEFCSKKFVQAGNYRSHLRVHTKERPYACSMCPKTYNQSSALKVHIRSHTNEKNYVCDTCSKAFTNSSDLNKHKRVHDPDLKFKCELCDKTFAQRVNLRNHMERHHQGDSAKGRKKKISK